MIDGDFMKMNNKGFAISTLVYGLSIMGIMLMAILMGVMAVNRSNNRLLSKEIEEDLNRYSQTDVSFSAISSNTPQLFEVPEGESGWYKIELWGASGQTTKNASGKVTSVNGGRGAYTYGVIELDEGDKIYILVGKSSATGGGQASEVRVFGSDIKSKIMVAAGGGYAKNSSGGTLAGYNQYMTCTGGKLNIAINSGNYGLKSADSTLIGCNKKYNYGTGTGPSALSQSSDSRFAEEAENNGGGGFFSSNNSNTGGTSFIAGYAGARGVELNGTLSNHPGVKRMVQKVDYDTGEKKEVEKTFYFVDGLMIAGVNAGDGKAKIERVVKKDDENQKLALMNEKLKNVTAITDCVGSGEEIATKISAVASGVDFAFNKTITHPAPASQCTKVDLGQAVDLDEIAVFHPSGVDYTNHTIKVTKGGGGGEVTIKNSNSSITSKSETETPTGYRVSAYQPDYTQRIPPKGNYYIIPVLSENKAFTASEKSDEEQQAITVDYLNGLKTQKWSIELLDDSYISPVAAQSPRGYEYKIVELARFRALNIMATENKEKNRIAAANEFNANGRNATQIWKIESAGGNWTYTIETANEDFTTARDTGYIVPQLDEAADDDGNVIIGYKNRVTERFKFFSIDYSGTK